MSMLHRFTAPRCTVEEAPDRLIRLNTAILQARLQEDVPRLRRLLAERKALRLYQERHRSVVALAG